MKKMFWSAIFYPGAERTLYFVFPSLEIRCKFLQVGHVGLTELD